MSKKKIILLILLMIGTIAFLVIRGKNGFVEVTPIEIDSVVVKKTVSASGVVSSESESDLALPTTGQLSHLSVEKGDFVTNGQYIGNVYNYDSSQSAQALKNARDVAEADVKIYVENYLTNPNAIGGWDEYNLNVKRLKVLQGKAEASYQSSLGSLSKTVLYSPFAGTIIDIFSDEGEVVTAGSSIVKIADLENLLFEISVDQEDFGLLQVDQSVEITLDSYGDHVFNGKVSALPHYVDEITEEFIIKIEIEPSAEVPVLLGMNGDASIIVESTVDEVAAVTFDHVYYNGGDTPFVWFDNNNTLDKLDVELGLEGDIYTEILTDLSNYSLVSPDDLDGVEVGSRVKFEDK